MCVCRANNKHRLNTELINYTNFDEQIIIEQEAKKKKRIIIFENSRSKYRFPLIWCPLFKSGHFLNDIYSF